MLFNQECENMYLGKTDITISQQGLGCMSMSEFYGEPVSDAQGISLIKTAYENGINFFDTADVYGYGRNEILLGKAITALINQGIPRHNLAIASKCGIFRDEFDSTKRGVDNSYDYIIQSCQNSLSRLGKPISYIDLYYLHRIANRGANIDESMRAMAKLLQDNKIKAVGLSEANAETIKKANEALLKYTHNQYQLAAVQSEYSLMTRHIERNDVLNTCRELNITFVAYSPLSRALLTGELTNTDQFKEGDFRRDLPRFRGENFEENKKRVAKIKEIATAKQCTSAQIALAWVMHQPGVVPIPGTTKQSHLLSNIAANNIELTHEELAILDQLGEAKGYRYTEAAMYAYGFEE